MNHQSAASEESLIVGLDIGTSKVVAIVGKLSSGRMIEVIGIGSHPSYGLKKGVVVDIHATAESILMAVKEAELMAGCRIHAVYTGIAGSHVQSINSNAVVAVQENEVSQQDVDRVMEAAQAVALPADQKILHVLPQEFIVGEQAGVKSPVGMSAIRLEAKVHLVTCSSSAVRNIKKCIQHCGLEMTDILLEQLASSYAVLTEDEKELGTCLLDIGRGTADIAVFAQGAIQHTAVIPIAGAQVTNDIAVVLKTPTQAAEIIKMKYACALKHLATEEQSIRVPSVVGDRPAQVLSRQSLAEIIEPRYAELLALVRSELYQYGYAEKIAAGIVLTGGTSKMEGAVELAESVLDMPARLGIPHILPGLAEIVHNPIYSTAVGLLVYGTKRFHGEPFYPTRDKFARAGWRSRVQHWIRAHC